MGQATTNIDSSEGRGPSTKVEGSVHWGALRDSSGFQTPGTTPNQSPPVLTSDLTPPLPSKVIRSAPPAVPPRVGYKAGQSISIPTSVITGPGYSANTPIRTGLLGAVPRRISSTDPEFLHSRKIPIVSTSVSSLDISQEVFKPDFTMEQQLEREAKNLKSMKRTLKREMKEFSDKDVTSQTLSRVEIEIDRIRKMKIDYQNMIEDFVEKWANTAVNVDGSVFESWTEEVENVADEVKSYVLRLTVKKEALTPTLAERNIQIAEATLK